MHYVSLLATGDGLIGVDIERLQLVLLFAAPVVLVGLWMTRVVRPSSLDNAKGRSAGQHPAGVWLVCALGLWCVGVAGALLGQSLPSNILGAKDSLQFQTLSSAVTYGLSIAVGLGLLMALRGGAKANDLRFASNDIPWGLLGLMLTIPLVVAASSGAMWIEERRTGVLPEPIAHKTLGAIIEGLRGGDPWAYGLIAIVVLCAPLVEEMIYRALLQTSMVRAVGSPWIAIFLTSAVFTFAHASIAPWYALPTLAVLSIAMGVAYERSASLIVPVTMHIGFNAMNVALAMMQKT